MDEILKQIMESDLLTEEVKSEIREKFAEQVALLRESIETEVRAALAEQWQKDRDLLIESVDQKVTAFLQTEISELKEDIDRFRDLEAEYAEKLVAEKRKLAESVGEEIDALVEKLDAFLEQRLTEEFAELAEDIEEAKANQFGRRLFEAFKAEFSKSFKDDDSSIYAKADVLEAKLTDAEQRIKELETERAKMIRESTLEKVLAPLDGAKREQMSIILSGVATERLQETYNKFIGKILAEAVEKQPITESKEETTVVTGNEEPAEQPARQQLTESAAKQRILRLAGVK